MALFQDLQVSDMNLWVNFQNYWEQGNYDLALNLLESNSQLLTKFVNADNLNQIANGIYNLEIQGQDPSFKSDKIQVASTPPALSTGEVYFQLD